MTARSSWAILRNFFYSHTCIHTHKIQGICQPRARPEIRGRVKARRERSIRDCEEGRKGEEKRDLGLCSRLGRPGRTNVFDSPEMNFPVVTTAAKYVKPSLQSLDHNMSKRDKI